MEQSEEYKELGDLCNTVRTLSLSGRYQQCEQIVIDAMSKFPSAAQPHNLFGLVLEREGKHASAMKHFRAAWALDPTYRPARVNLDHYGTFCCDGTCAYDESDCSADIQKMGNGKKDA